MLLSNMYIKFGNILRCATSAEMLLMWGKLLFGAVQLFWHIVHIAKGSTLLKGCKSMFNIINICSLLQGIWCRNGCGRKGWISCCNTAWPKQAIGPTIGIMLIFLSQYSLESGFLSAQISLLLSVGESHRRPWTMLDAIIAWKNNGKMLFWPVSANRNPLGGLSPETRTLFSCLQNLHKTFHIC